MLAVIKQSLKSLDKTDHWLRQGRVTVSAVSVSSGGGRPFRTPFARSFYVYR